MTETLQKSANEIHVIDTDTAQKHQLRIAAQLDRLELSDADVDIQFAGIVEFSKQIHLVDRVKNDEIDAYLQDVPLAATLIDKVHSLASVVLETETIDNDSVTVVYDLGVAADLTRDRSLLERTAEILRDETQAYNLEPLERAINLAIEKDELFTTAYKKITATKKASSIALRDIDHERMQVFGPRDETTELLYPRTRPVTRQPEVKGITLISDIQGEVRPGFIEVNSQAFTEGHVRKMAASATIQLAMKDFIAHVRNKS